MPKVSCPYCGQAYSYETLGPNRTISCESCNHSFTVAEPTFEPKRGKTVWVLGVIVVVLLLAGEAFLFFTAFQDKKTPPPPPLPPPVREVAAEPPAGGIEQELLKAEIQQLRDELATYRVATDETLQAHTDRLEQVKQFDSSMLDYINYYNNYFQDVEAFAAGERELNLQYENAFKELYTVCARQNEVIGLTANYAANGSVLGRLNSLENQIAALSDNYNNNNYNGLWRGWGTTVIIPNWNRPHPPKPPKPPQPPKPPKPEPPKPPRPEPRPTPPPTSISGPVPVQANK